MKLFLELALILISDFRLKLSSVLFVPPHRFKFFVKKVGYLLISAPDAVCFPALTHHSSKMSYKPFPPQHDYQNRNLDYMLQENGPAMTLEVLLLPLSFRGCFQGNNCAIVLFGAEFKSVQERAGVCDAVKKGELPGIKRDTFIPQCSIGQAVKSMC